MARQDPTAFAAALPCWSGHVSPVPLAGGMTNSNFLIEDGGRRYVARIGGDIPAHSIVRVTETAACRAAHEAGVSPQVFYSDPNAPIATKKKAADWAKTLDELNTLRALPDSPAQKTTISGILREQLAFPDDAMEFASAGRSQ